MARRPTRAPSSARAARGVTTQVAELSYLHSRDITYAVFCQGPYEESVRYRDFMGWDMPWYSAQASLDTLLVGRQIGMMHLVCYLRDGDRVFETYWTTRRGVEAMDNSYALMDLTVYGRQEPWEDSPAGWPQPVAVGRLNDRINGRPIAQWSRLEAGRSDDLTVGGGMTTDTLPRPGVPRRLPADARRDGVGMVVLGPLPCASCTTPEPRGKCWRWSPRWPSQRWRGWGGDAWPAGVLEMTVVMYASVAVLFPFYWLGVLGPNALMVLGHVLMVVGMAIAIPRTRRSRATRADRRHGTRSW